MRKQIPLLITFLMGIFMGVQYFVPHEISEKFYRGALDWMLIIGIFAMMLGVASLVKLHWVKIQRSKSERVYSIVLLISLVITTIVGLVQGMEQGTIFVWIYNYVMNPIMATMFAMLAFFIASASYRAFRARSGAATVLLLGAILVMLGRVPIGEFLTIRVGESYFGVPQISDWILNVPNMASKRAIFFGIGLGAIAMSLKIIVGIERSYMGGG